MTLEVKFDSYGKELGLNSAFVVPLFVCLFVFSTINDHGKNCGGVRLDHNVTLKVCSS